MSIFIKKASILDLSTLQSLGRETFYETFAQHNPEEEMQNYLDKSFALDKLTGELNHQDSQFFIVWEENTPVGYLKVNTGTAQTELQDETSLEIERIYVKSSHHGKKVGQVLYEKALEIAREENKKYIWLEFGKKTRELLVFIKRMVLWNLTNIFSGWEVKSKLT
jgi:GNAT superfamily N-acetyltransferase